MTFWPTELVQAIARRRCVLLIGSGISANSQNKKGDRPLTWGAFLEDAHKKLPKKKLHITKALKANKYLEACYYLKEAHGEANWTTLLKSSFLSPNYQHAKIHEEIFNLDCRIVASMNFDKIYENYAAKVSDGTYIIKNYYDTDIRQVVAGNGRYVLKPHGTIDTPSKLIFTVEEYAKAKIEYSSFYEILTALLHTHTILCLGCGVADPDMQWIFEDYRYKYSECPHYIVLPEPVAEEQETLLQKTRGLNVLSYSSKGGHKILTEELEKLSQLVTLERAEIAASQNW